MNRLPDNPNIEQLKRQAKELIAGYRAGRPKTFERFRHSLPDAAGRDNATLTAMSLKLHDAQSCIAREYGFASWAELSQEIESRRLSSMTPADLKSHVLGLLYPGDVAGGMNGPRPQLVIRLLEEHPDLASGDPYLACAVGDIATVRQHVRADPSWVNAAGGPLALPPLVAATHSGLLRTEHYRDKIRAVVGFLLEAGADPNRSVGSRWPPASLHQPDMTNPLTPLYGAAGQNHDTALTRLLLEAGADPNDNESLYHSFENPTCTRLLLDAGAIISGTNALFRILDLDDVDTLRLLLSRAPDAPELKDGKLLFWAIKRRRSVAHVEALLEAGVDPSARTEDGVSAHTLACRYGLTDVARVLDRGEAHELTQEDQFVAACARGDRPAAEQIRSAQPDFPGSLSERHLRMLPDLAAEGCAAAVDVMIGLGWPVAVRGGDWNASALNQAVFRGDAGMARRLLEHGALWTEEHGFDDNVCGTLSWASINQPVEGGDWVGCARALVEHGMPRAVDGPGGLTVDGKTRVFSDPVTEALLESDTDPRQ